MDAFLKIEFLKIHLEKERKFKNCPYTVESLRA